jgi:hypothetical protein
MVKKMIKMYEIMKKMKRSNELLILHLRNAKTCKTAPG